jgi:RimJ/RimL family protein N-acetyltransferase
LQEQLETPRLRLRRPIPLDAQAIFSRYASDAEVTKYLAWPRHQSIEDTKTFLHHADAEWSQWQIGAFLIEDRESGVILGSTGVHPLTTKVAMVGYVLARDAWGRGVATEALASIISLAQLRGFQRLSASCHVDHVASARVLQKSGFLELAGQHKPLTFPNLPATANQVPRMFEMPL